jgi:hypothetical protein
MSIGRTFEEAIQKAVRMVAPGQEGLEGEWSQVTSSVYRLSLHKLSLIDGVVFDQCSAVACVVAALCAVDVVAQQSQRCLSLVAQSVPLATQ